jgi:hypothetical protein
MPSWTSTTGTLCGDRTRASIEPGDREAAAPGLYLLTTNPSISADLTAILLWDAFQCIGNSLAQ